MSSAGVGGKKLARSDFVACSRPPREAPASSPSQRTWPRQADSKMQGRGKPDGGGSRERDSPPARRGDALRALRGGPFWTKERRRRESLERLREPPRRE